MNKYHKENRFPKQVINKEESWKQQDDKEIKSYCTYDVNEKTVSNSTNKGNKIALCTH